MKVNLLIFFFFLFFISCKSKKVTSPIEDKVSKNLDLMAADRAFSAMSQEKGMKAAFSEYLDSNGTMLRPDQMPINAGDAIDFLIQQDDAGYTLGWDPRHAEVAESGEMGFTYGIYMLRPKSIDTVYYGTYTNIWKKHIDGKWKLILNSENQGVEK